MLRLRPTPLHWRRCAFRRLAKPSAGFWARDTADGGGVRVLKFRFGSPFIQLDGREYGREGLVPYDAPTKMTEQVATEWQQSKRHKGNILGRTSSADGLFDLPEGEA